MDPLPSQLRLILGGSKVELDNKAIEGFSFSAKEGDAQEEIELSNVFPTMGDFFNSLHKNEVIVSFIK